ncbi:MAG: patatin-like phospholipase family protein [Chloroflexi bacterium]|nr:patatin-like phospholipase family protein [Chloroflexota bacterium]
MKPFRQHVAIAIDGGGIRGIMVTRALEVLEAALGKKLGEVCEIAAGTSTGSVVAAGIALDKSAAEMTQLYRVVSPKIFQKSLRSALWLLFPYRYSNAALKEEFDQQSAGKTMGDLWTDARKFDLVIAARDMHTARTRFFKSWKPEYAAMPITTAVLASAAAPTYFPVVAGRYVDGGVGSFGNPTFIAAYEARFVLGWKPEETTLISVGTGRVAGGGYPIGAPDKLRSAQWIMPLMDALMSDANDQQSRVVDQLFTGMDFRRFQISIEKIDLDDVAALDRLVEHGKRFGEMMVNDETDPDLQTPVYKVV